MPHALSSDDRLFKTEFEACRLSPAQFNHRAHIRLAYAYLAENTSEAALEHMRRALRAFLQHHGVPPSKYHETLTHAWILAVRHVMERSPASSSAAAFIDVNPDLLDTEIMMTHYSTDLLFSAEARAQFIEPDVEAIPRYDL